MNCPLVILTNTAYKYLWPIINDTTSHLKEVILGVDKNDLSYKFNDNIKIVYYEPGSKYTLRILKMLEEVATDYLIFSHDVDLILNLDPVEMNRYLELCMTQGVDRLSLGVFKTSNKVLSSGDIQICNINVDYKNGFNLNQLSSNFYTPYDYAPSFYKKTKLKELCEKFPFETYGTCERNIVVQHYVNSHFNCYGLQKNNTLELVYHRGFVYSKNANFLHITVGGKLLPYNLYFDLEKEVLEIIRKYNLVLPQEQGIYINKNEI